MPCRSEHVGARSYIVLVRLVGLDGGGLIGIGVESRKKRLANETGPCGNRGGRPGERNHG